MKKLLVMTALSLGAGWYYFGSNETAREPASLDAETDEIATEVVTEKEPDDQSADEKLYSAAQKLVASNFSSEYTNGFNQGFKSFGAFFDTKPGGKEALALLDDLDRSNSEEKMSDEVFAVLSESLNQISVKDDLPTRLKILNALASDPERSTAVRGLALREIFTKMPHTQDERDRGEQERAVAAYETYLKTNPDSEEIMRVTVDSFYFNEDPSLNEEIKTILGAKFPDLLPQIESRFKDPSGEGSSGPDSEPVS